MGPSYYLLQLSSHVSFVLLCDVSVSCREHLCVISWTSDAHRRVVVRVAKAVLVIDILWYGALLCTDVRSPTLCVRVTTESACSMSSTLPLTSIAPFPNLITTTVSRLSYVQHLTRLSPYGWTAIGSICVGSWSTLFCGCGMPCVIHNAPLAHVGTVLQLSFPIHSFSALPIAHCPLYSLIGSCHCGSLHKQPMKKI